MTEPILNKKQNYRLWQSGAFGNKLRAWRTVESWWDSGFEGRVVLRTLLPLGNGPCVYNLLPDDAFYTAQVWITQGIPSDAIMINEAAPDQDVILQGEYLNDVCEIDGRVYWSIFKNSFVQAHMRDALKQSHLTVGNMNADHLIRSAMTPASYEDWQELITRYPGHVLEVSIYDRCLGDLPHRNALVWEVRRY
jgi:hypothetical protein